MRILLVEDRPGMRQNYYHALKDYHEKIEVIQARSFEELQGIMLSFQLDGAIIDYDLSNWERNTKFAAELDGIKVCDFLTKNTNFKDNFSNLVLYSADLDITNIKGKPYKIIRGKSAKANVTQAFHDEVVKDMTDFWNLDKAVEFNEFSNYCASKKISYYKSILANKNVERSFRDFANEISWASDFLNDDGKLFVGRSLTKTIQRYHEFEICDYEYIEQYSLELNKIPNVIWNFTKASHFEIQTRFIKDKEFNENILKTFYNVCFSASMSKYLLNASAVDNDKLLKILRVQDELSLREAQCSVIRLMHKNGDSAGKIKDRINDISNRVDYNITELFEAEILARDTAARTVSVELTSLIDREIRYVKEFDFAKLEHYGIDKDDDNFYYCISESARNGGHTTYLEPIIN